MEDNQALNMSALAAQPQAAPSMAAVQRCFFMLQPLKDSDKSDLSLPCIELSNDSVNILGREHSIEELINNGNNILEGGRCHERPEWNITNSLTA